jgi:hypothetical protein
VSEDSNCAKVRKLETKGYTIMSIHTLIYIFIVECRPVAGQRPLDTQIYNSRYKVTVSQTNVFQRQLNTATEKRCFLCGMYRVYISRTVCEVKSVECS